MLGIETTNGEATGVVTGSRVVAANAVLCAAGIGSADLARTIGISLPIQIVRASVAQTKATRVTMQTAVWAPHVAFRPKGGSLLVEASLLTVAVVHNSMDISRSFTNPGIQATARGPRRSGPSRRSCSREARCVRSGWKSAARRRLRRVCPRRRRGVRQPTRFGHRDGSRFQGMAQIRLNKAILLHIRSKSAF